MVPKCPLLVSNLAIRHEITKRFSSWNLFYDPRLTRRWICLGHGQLPLVGLRAPPRGEKDEWTLFKKLSSEYCMCYHCVLGLKAGLCFGFQVAGSSKTWESFKNIVLQSFCFKNVYLITLLNELSMTFDLLRLNLGTERHFGIHLIFCQGRKDTLCLIPYLTPVCSEK